MVECEWMILCDYAFMAERGKLCLIGLFDRVFASKVPTRHRQAALAFFLIGEPKEEISLRLEIVRPTGQTLMSIEAKSQLADNGTLRAHVGLADLTLPDFGNYGFNMYSGDALIKTFTFSVQQPPTQSPPTQASAG